MTGFVYVIFYLKSSKNGCKAKFHIYRMRTLDLMAFFNFIFSIIHEHEQFVFYFQKIWNVECKSSAACNRKYKWALLCKEVRPTLLNPWATMFVFFLQNVYSGFPCIINFNISYFSPRKMWLKHNRLRVLKILIISFCFFTRRKTSSFVICCVQGILNTRLYIHSSKNSNVFIIFLLNVQASNPLNKTGNA